MDSSKVRRLYDAMSAKYNMTQAFDEFEAALNDEEKRRKVYDAMSAKYNMTQAFDEFSKSLVGDIADDAAQSNQQYIDSATPAPAPHPATRLQADSTFLTDDDRQSVADTAKMSWKEARRLGQAAQGIAGQRPTADSAQAASQFINANREAVSQMEETEKLNQQRRIEAAEPIAEAFRALSEDYKEQAKTFREESLQLERDYFALTQAARDYATSKYGPQPAKLSSEEGWGKAYMEYLEGNDPNKVYERYNNSKERVSRDNTVTFLEHMANQTERRARQTLRQAERGVVGNTIAGAGYGISQPGSWSLGMSELWTAENVISLANKLKDGERLTDYEQAALDAYGTYQEAASILHEYDTRGFKAGVTTGEMAPFMVQMAWNPAGKLGTTLAQKGVRKAVMNAAKGSSREAAEAVAEEAMKKYGTMATRDLLRNYGVDGAMARIPIAMRKVGGDLAASAVLANTLQAGSTLNNIAERKYGAPVQDGEHYTFDPEQERTWAEAAYKGELSSIIENFTEMMGEWRVLGLADKMSKFGSNSVGRLVRAMGDTDFAKGLGKVLQDAHWSGTIGEMLEEEYGIILNSLLTGDNKISDLWDLDQQIDIFLGVGLFGGVMGGAKMAAYPIAYVNSKKKLEEVTNYNQENITDWAKIQDAIDNADNNGLVGIIGSALRDRENGSFNGRAEAILNYIDALQHFRGVTIARDMLPADADAKTMQAFYLQGYDGTDKQAVSAAYQHRKSQMELMNPGITSILDTFGIDAEMRDEKGDIVPIFEGEYRQMALDYLDAKAAYDGMLDGITDRAQTKARAAEAIVRSNDNNGSQIEATTRTGESVHIISGDIIMAEGTANLDQSSKSIVIRHEDGTKEMVSPLFIKSIDLVTDTESAATMAAQRAAQESVLTESQEAEIPDADAGMQAMADNELGQQRGIEQADYQIGDMIALPDGTTGRVNLGVGQTEDGTVEVIWDTPEGNKVGRYTADQLYDMQHPEGTAAAAAAAAQTEQVEATQENTEPTPQQQAYDEWVAKHGDNALNKLNQTRAYAEKELAARQKELNKVQSELNDLPDVEDEAITKKKAELEKKQAELQAAIDNYSATLDRMNAIQSVYDAQNQKSPVEQKNEAVRQRAAEWEKNTGVKVTILERLEDVPLEVARKKIQAGDDIKGWYNKGEVYIYLPNATGVEDLDQTFIHEVIAHKGIKEMLNMVGKGNYARLCRQVWDQLMTERQKQEYLAKVAHIEGEEAKRLAAADEFIAYFAERMSLDPTAEERATWEEFIKMLWDMLRKVFGAQITEQDLSDLVVSSLARYRIMQAEQAQEAVSATRLNRLKVAELRAMAAPVVEGWKGGPKLVNRLTKAECIRILTLNGEYSALADESGSGSTEAAAKAAEIRQLIKDLNAKYTPKKKMKRVKKPTDFQAMREAVDDVIDEMDFETQVRFATSRYGQNIVWDNDPVSGTKGLGSHIIATRDGASQSDRQKYFPWQKARRNGGLYPEEVAERIMADLPESVKEGYDTRDALRVVLDAITGSTSPSDVVRQVYQDLIERQQAAEREEEERQQDAYAKERGFGSYEELVIFDANEDLAPLTEEEWNNLYEYLYDEGTDGSSTQGVQGMVQQPAGQGENISGGNEVGREQGSAEQVPSNGRTEAQEGSNPVLPGTEGERVGLTDEQVEAIAFVTGKSEEEIRAQQGGLPYDAKGEKTLHHPATLRAAYESGNAADIAKAEKAVGDYIMSSNSIERLDSTAKEFAARKKQAEKGSAEYRMDDFCEKKCRERIKEIKREAAEVKEPTERIDDVGEKIGGARKDLAQKMSDKIDLDADNFPKMFPKFDLKKMVEQGLDPKLAAPVQFLRQAAYEEYKRYTKRYGKKYALKAAQFYAAYAKRLLETGNADVDFKDSGFAFTEYGQAYIKTNIALFEKIYEALGDDMFGLDLKDYYIIPLTAGSRANSKYYRRGENGEMEQVDAYYATSHVGGGTSYYEEGRLGDAINEVVGRLTESVDYKKSHPYKLVHYYRPGVRNSDYIGVKLGGKVVPLTDTMSSAEVQRYMRDHEAELQEKARMLDEQRKQKGEKSGGEGRWKPELTLGGKRTRVGKDFRGGRNVSPEEFRSTFGFRGVEFGNYVTQQERQRFLNESYDALMDMADMLGVSPKALSLGGQLGFAIGSRGGGGQAAAHYEPGKNVINLTKTQGAGSLAHEWWHALDYYLNRDSEGRRKKSATANRRQEDFNADAASTDTINAFLSLMRAIEESEYMERSKQLEEKVHPNRIGEGYYDKPTELAARAFQDYVQRRLTDSGQINDFLSSFTPEDRWNGEPDTYPYPQGEEATRLGSVFDSMFATMQEREEDGNVVLFRMAPNGKESKLTDKQWAQVRTPEFKNWFGDWEKAELASYLLSNKTVADLEGNEFEKDGTPLTDKVTQFYKEKYNGQVQRDGVGTILLDERSVRDSIGHGIGRMKSAAFAAVPNIITDGRIIDSQENWKGRGYGSVTFAAPVSIGGENYVGIVVANELKKNEKGSHRFYLHEVMLQKNLRDEEFKTGINTGSYHGDIANIIKDILSASKNSSKVVDENGEPMVVYHGTPHYRFNAFAQPGTNLQGLIWTTGAKKYAETYAAPDEEVRENEEVFSEPNVPQKDGIYSLFANIKNPIELGNIDDEVGSDTWNAIAQKFKLTPEELFNRIGWEGSKYKDSVEQGDAIYELTRGDKFVNLLKEYGFDGVIAKEGGPGIGGAFKTYGAVSGNQVKSAEPFVLDDNGKLIPLSERFSDNNWDIRFREANENQAIFVSNAAKAVESIKQDKATPDQWLAMIQKQGGIKAGEDKWLGLSQWLKDRKEAGVKTLTKQEIEEFIDANKIEITEERYADTLEGLTDLQVEFDGIYDRIIDGIENGEAEDYDAMAQKAETWDEFSDYTSRAVMNPRQLAWEELRDNHYGGDDFDMAFSYNDQGLIEIDDEDRAGYFLGVKPINSTRLGYTTEGLDNKREIALTVPTIEPWNESDDIHFGDAGGGRAIAWIRFGETYDKTQRIPIDSHVDEFEEPVRNANGRLLYYPKGADRFSAKEYVVYGRIRTGEDKYVPMVNDGNKQIGSFDTLEEARQALNEWYGNNPKTKAVSSKVLVIDEIQSKRHQEGREKGYSTNLSIPEMKRIGWRVEKEEGHKWWNAYNPNGDRALYGMYVENEQQAWELTQKEIAKQGIPAAPFDKNWQELAMKRMLRLAAEEGYDKVAWTTGEQQNERYDLGQFVEYIHRGTVNEDGTIPVGIKFNDSQIVVEVDKQGNITYSAFADLEGKTLQDLIGKELAIKVLTSDAETDISGEGLRVGAEGMKTFYDKMLVNLMNKYGKQWGVKVEDVHLPGLSERGKWVNAGDQPGGGLFMHSIDVTPEMKRDVMEGQVMFREANDKNKQPDTPEPDLDAADTVLFRVSNRDRETISRWLSKRTDLTEPERQKMLDYLDTLDDKKMQLAAGWWFAKGTIRLPEDMPKVEQAVQVAGIAKVDPLRYDSPMELINAHADIQVKEKPINPDEVKTLHKAKELPGGIVVYDVDDTEESRENMRRIINTHFGKEASPWCLLQGDSKGNLTEGSSQYWKHYNAYPKQVAFRNGRLVAFSANDSKKRVWWDRMDQPLDGIPYGEQTLNDGYKQKTMMTPDGNAREYGNIYKGNKENGPYEELWPNGNVKMRCTYKNGYLDGLYESFYEDGRPMQKFNYIDGKEQGWGRHWFNNGRLAARTLYKNGMLVFREGWDEDGNYVHMLQNNDEKYENSTWYDNGQMESRFTGELRDGELYGISEDWNRRGRMISKTRVMGHMVTEVLPVTRDKGMPAPDKFNEEEEQGVRFRVVTDPLAIASLEAGKKQSGFRTVALNEDATFGSPMAGRLGRTGGGSVETSRFELGKWEQAEENPEMATEGGKVNLIKPNGRGSVGGVDYNPYIHIRPTSVNRQFTQAWARPELVYIETEYPESELTSGYKADKAKLPVGRHPWNGGELILSRYDKPKRIVPWEEVADEWEKEFKDSGVTFDIVAPELLPILSERGVEILPPKKAAGKAAMDAYKKWLGERGLEGGDEIHMRIANEALKVLDAYENGEGFGSYLSLVDDIENSDVLMKDKTLSSLIGEYRSLQEVDRMEGRRDYTGGEMDDLVEDEIIPRLRSLADDDIRFRESGEQLGLFSPEEMNGDVAGSQKNINFASSKKSNERGESDIQREGSPDRADSTGRRGDGISQTATSEPAQQSAESVVKPLRKLEEGETCYVERKLSEAGDFSFIGKDRIETIEDVAFIFRKLETKAVENAFIAFVKNGKATILHVGMGPIAASLVDLTPVTVMMKNINPDKVYFIHNHPSGQLISSAPDRQLWQEMRKIMGDTLAPGIIIDTTRGEYGMFEGDAGFNDTKVFTENSKGEQRIPVYRFDERVFSKDYDPESRPIFTSWDIAAFVAGHRLGERDKISVLCLDHGAKIVGNFFLPYKDFSSADIINKIAVESAYYAGMCGATGIMLYGNGVDPNTTNLASLAVRTLRRFFEANQLRLLDIVGCYREDNGYYYSYADHGIAEPGMEYGKQEALKQAEAETDTNPSEGQKEAGNYKKGHVRLFGMNLSIEQPRGSVRSGTDADGKQWSQEMNNTYGYIRGTMGRDKDHIDVFLGDKLNSDKVFVVDQRNIKDGSFDEHKVMLGFDDIDAARKAYESNYEKGWRGMAAITETTLDDFKEWAFADGRRVQPFSSLAKTNEAGSVRRTDAAYAEYDHMEQMAAVAQGVNDDAELEDISELLKESKPGTPEYETYSSIYVLAASGKSVREAKESIINQTANATQSPKERLQEQEVAPVVEPIANLAGVRFRISNEPSRVRSAYNDGDIVVYNPRTPADVQAAVMREAFTHKDIRDVPGWDDVTDAAYRLSDGEIATGAIRNGMDFDAATEEWMYGNAERMVVPFERMMSRNGVSLLYRMTGDEIRMYLTKTSDLLDDAELFIAKEELPVEEGVRFRTKKPAPTTVSELYDASQDSILNRIYRGYVDYSKPIRDYQDIVEHKTGEKLKDYENPWEAENQRPGKNANQLAQMRLRLLNPMYDAVRALRKATGMSKKDILRYLIAKHGLERNMVLARRDAEAEFKKYQEEHPAGTKTEDDFYNKNRKRDYSGLTALSGKEDVAEAEDYARALVDAVESSALVEAEALWKTINEISAFERKTRYESGLISKERMQREADMFDNYIPLRGFDEEIAEDRYDYYEDVQRNRPQRDRKAKGRTSLADDPLATLSAMAAQAIVAANRNLVKQKFLNLVQNHPNELATVQNVWVINHGTPTDPIWEPEYPDIRDGMSADEIRQELERYKQRMELMEAAGTAKKAKNKLNIKWRTLGAQEHQHLIPVWRNGEQVVIIINGNPQLARTMNGINNPDANLTPFLRFFKAINRFMAGNFTMRNPKFVLSNLLRDRGFAILFTTAEERAEFRHLFMKNMMFPAVRGVKMGSLIHKWKKGTLDMDDDVQRYFSEFMENGGETGFTAENTVDAYRKMLDKGIKNKNFAVKGVEAVFNFFETCNRAVEDLTRFATYMTCRQMGRSVQKSVAAAKDVTVNFNRKGSGEYGQKYIAAVYLFLNPAMQSLQKLNKAFGVELGMKWDKGKMGIKIDWKKFGKTSTEILGFQVMLGMIIPMLNELLMGLLGDDDDDETEVDENGVAFTTNPYRRLTEWERRSNICLWIPFSYKESENGKRKLRWGQSDSFIKIPMGPELRALYGLGETAYSYLAGIPNPDPGMDVVRQLVDMMPVNFLEPGGWTPDIVAPISEVKQNQNYRGVPIYKDSEYLQYEPEYKKVYSGTGDAYIALSHWFNEISGGDDVRKGKLDGKWTNPAVMQHLVEGYLGGMLTTARQTAKLVGWSIQKFVKGEDVEPLPAREWPIVNALYVDTDQRRDDRHVKDRYYYYRDQADKMQHDLKGYEKLLNDPEYAKKYHELITSPEYHDYKTFDALNQAVKDAHQDVKEYGDEFKVFEVDAMRNLVNALDEDTEAIISPEQWGKDRRGNKNIGE